MKSALDKIFRYTERGSSLGRELWAGCSSCFIAVCALVMNTRIIGEAYGNYAGSYLATTLVCALGTLLLGILANLPLVQSANMGMSTLLISMLGSGSGLTYPNLLAVSFVSALIYLVIAVTPARKFLIDALPAGVKKALPVGTGLFVALKALQNMGIVTEAGQLVKASSLTTLDRYYFFLCIAGLLLFILFKALKFKKPVLTVFGILVGCMWVGGIVFYMDYFIGGQTAATVVYHRLNLVIATDGASPYNIGVGLSSLKLGALFTEGFDFSGYNGSVLLLFVQSVLTFLLMGLYTDLGNARGTAAAGEYDEADFCEAGERKALIVSAAMNVAAPLLGSAPVAIGAESGAAAEDGGKTGLASLTAAVGLIIACFCWIFVLLFATGTHGVGMWIDLTETKLAAYVQDTFIFTDLAMVLVGASMLKGLRTVDTKALEELIPFAAVVIAAALGNIALGAALGTAAYVLCAGRRSLQAGRKPLQGFRNLPEFFDEKLAARQLDHRDLSEFFDEKLAAKEHKDRKDRKDLLLSEILLGVGMLVYVIINII